MGYQMFFANNRRWLILELGARAREVVLRGQGATLRNYELLMPLLCSGGERLPASAFDRTMPPTLSDPDST